MLRRHTFRVHKLFPHITDLRPPPTCGKPPKKPRFRTSSREIRIDPKDVSRDYNRGDCGDTEAGTVWRCLENCWEVFLTKLIKQLPCCFWNFWLRFVRLQKLLLWHLMETHLWTFIFQIWAIVAKRSMPWPAAVQVCILSTACPVRSTECGVLVPSIAPKGSGGFYCRDLGSF